MWHLIVTSDAVDAYSPSLRSSDARLILPLNHPTSPWKIGNDTEEVLAERLGLHLDPVVRDLVRLAVAVFTADLRVPRDRFEDRWTREIALYMPVSDVARWDRATPTLLEMLNFLSGDHWHVEFRKDESTVEEQDLEPQVCDSACLFSGGLDSLVGAIDLLAAGKRVALVSHHGLGDGAKSLQVRLVNSLLETFPDQILHVPFYVHPDRGNTTEGENTMRARSILFMAMGIATATSISDSPNLTVPENGLISLNVPLTAARSGSASTRTTHPHYIDLFRKLLDALGTGMEITLPYRHMTKGEMLRQVSQKAALDGTAALTMSCSHPTVGRYRGLTPGNHCGYCVPCIIRFASLQAAGIKYTAPDFDVVHDTPPDGSDIGNDVRAFKIGLERLGHNDPKLDIFQVLRSGPVPVVEARQFAEVYRRGMREVASFLNVKMP